MALTKIGKEGITGISNSSDATFLTATSSEGVTLAGTLAVTGVHTIGNNAVATTSGGSATHNLSSSLVSARGTSNAAGTSSSGTMNVSSLTDTNTGQQRFTFTTAHSATPSTVAAGQSVSANLTFTGSATTFCDVFSFNQSSYVDMALTFICNGDLA